MTAIVTSGETRQSLTAVRSLGRAGIPVAVGAKKRPTLSMWSRYATSTFLTEDEDRAAYLFAEQMGEEVRARYASCLFVSTDNALWALSRFRELLPASAQRLLPPHYSVVRSLDHEALHHFAGSLAIPCAGLIRIDEHASEEQIIKAVKKLTFPLLLRPIIPWIEREDGTRKMASRLVVQSLKHLRSVLHSGDLLTNGFLVSAYTSVRALSYFGVAEKGQVLVEGFQERLNELEPYNEVATLAVTIAPVPSIRNHAQNLLHALQWQGPFKVEFIKDKRGSYRLISLIGRLWGSMQLAVKANVNIPLICYRLAEGSLSKDLLKNARPHIRMRWLLGDAVAKISYPQKFFSGFKTWAHHLHPKHHFGKEKITTYYDVMDMDDPMPFLFELQSKTWKRALSGCS